VYHATKYMALPSILFHDPTLQSLFLRLSDCQVYKNQKATSQSPSIFTDPIKIFKSRIGHIRRKMSDVRKIKMLRKGLKNS
jgi:hypothetical protein